MRPRLQQALQLLDGAALHLALEHDEQLSFSELAFQTRFALFVDWRVKNFTALESLMSRFAREIPLDLIRHGDDCELLVEADGNEQRTIIRDVDSLDRDTAVATFLALLPQPFVALRLLRFDPSDADHYLVVDQARAEAVLRVLGTDATLLFKRLPAP